MNIPNCQDAYIPDAKLVNYLLNYAHPQNKGKARFYDLAGYNLSNIEELRIAIVQLACAGNVINKESNEEGTKYVVTGMINGANGRQYELRTVWIVEPPNYKPRLVTAYPN